MKNTVLATLDVFDTVIACNVWEDSVGGSHSSFKPNINVRFKLQEGMREAKSNIEFLQILKEPCDKLDETTSPDIPKIIPELLQTVRIIWVNSPYYNTR
jgi:dynein heavy chain